MTSYADKFKDARWQKKRLEVLTDADWTCEECGTKSQENGATMNVHHKFYGFAKKRDPWEYESFELMALCEDCHKKMPRGNEEWEWSISTLCVYGIDSSNVQSFTVACGNIVRRIADMLAEEDGVNFKDKTLSASAKRKYRRMAVRKFIIGMDVLGAEEIAAIAVIRLCEAASSGDDE